MWMDPTESIFWKKNVGWAGSIHIDAGNTIAAKPAQSSECKFLRKNKIEPKKMLKKNAY